MLLHGGTRIDLGILGEAKVGRELGQGGEGYVYEVHREGGRPLALKWYKPQCATPAQKAALTMLVEQGAPHPRFLWPLSLGHVAGEPSFGYVMPLRPSRFMEMAYLVSGRTPEGKELVTSFAAVISLCRQLADSFLRLHSRGLCYRDISFGNVAFDPETGDACICDNDNVGIDNGGGRILGTPFFMAPEVVSDTTLRTMPNTDTDRHSLAVLLFYALCVGHPLEGRRTETGLRDASWLMRHFGTDPLFTFDPDDDSNRPVEGTVQAYWDIYPAFVREAFTRAFTEGLRDPGSRVTESEWIKVADRLADSMIQCAQCGATNFWDESDPSPSCARCQTPVRPPFVLSVGRRQVAVSRFARIRSEHLRLAAGESEDVARVRRHPTDSQRWGLENLTKRSWEAVLPDATAYQVQPGHTVELSGGLRINMRPGEIVVR